MILLCLGGDTIVVGDDTIVATNPDRRCFLDMVIPSPELLCFGCICRIRVCSHERDFRFVRKRHTPHKFQALDIFDISRCLSGPLSYRLTADFGPLRGCVDCLLQNTRKILESSPLFLSTYDVPLSHQISSYVSQRSSGGHKRTSFPPIRLHSVSFFSL